MIIGGGARVARARLERRKEVVEKRLEKLKDPRQRAYAEAALVIIERKLRPLASDE